MSDREILEKAIDIAVSSGWRFAGNNKDAVISVHTDDYGEHPEIWIDWKMPTKPTKLSIEEVIFSHDFAEALWGEDARPVRDDERMTTWSLNFYPWQYHLREMVISSNPVEYLEQNI